MLKDELTFAMQNRRDWENYEIQRAQFYPRHCDLIGLGYGWAIRIVFISLDDCNVKPGLRTTDQNHSDNKIRIRRGSGC